MPRYSWMNETWDVDRLKRRLKYKDFPCSIGHLSFVRSCNRCTDLQRERIIAEAKLEAAIYRNALQNILDTTGCDAAYNIAERTLNKYEVPAGTDPNWWW